MVLLSSCGCHSVLAGGCCDVPGESEVGVPLWPGCWAGPGDSDCSPLRDLPATSAGWHRSLGTGGAGAGGAASPGHGQRSCLPCAWPHPFSWQVQCGRGPHLEHTQLHQHLRVCGRAAERAGGGDAGHDVSDRRGGLWRGGRPGPWLLRPPAPSPSSLPPRLHTCLVSAAQCALSPQPLGRATVSMSKDSDDLPRSTVC